MLKPDNKENIYDVIVIGGGPSGMMAAGTAGRAGARVLLLEKNAGLGKKLLITGGGRCNLTNAEFDTRTLLAHYKDSAKFLFSTFSQHNVADTLNFFHDRGLATKVEEHKRVFPISDSARSVYDVLINYLKESKVAVKNHAEVKTLVSSKDKITAVTLTDSTTYRAESYIIATGGKSHPETGSTGDGFRWLSLLSHNVIAPDPSLVPLTVKDIWIKELAGLTWPETKISVYQSTKKAFSKSGRILFTHVGVSGPTILNMSKMIGELLDYGPVTLSLDLFPKADIGSLDDAIINLFSEHSNKLFKNVLAGFLPPTLAKVVIKLSGIGPETKCHSITKEERRRLVHLLKDFQLNISGLLGADMAIVTSGGIDLTEVDFKTMRSRKFSNLYLTGDILNIDRPSGGYSLQLCWSTGFVAGQAATQAK